MGLQNWKRIPPAIEEFIDEPFYLGLGEQVCPRYRRCCRRRGRVKTGPDFGELRTGAEAFRLPARKHPPRARWAP